MENYKDYSAFLQTAQIEYADWSYDDQDTLANNLLDLIRQSVIIPDPQIYYPIITAYLLLPSALCSSFPYLLCYGKAGCGKSTIGYIAAGLYGVEVLQGNTTFAALRNTTNTRLFHDKEIKESRRNACLIWDDIEPRFLRDEKMYSFFKSGYKLKSDLCRLAGKEPGEVMEFHTFIPKIFSTIHNFFTRHEFSEIERRLIVIPHKRYSEFTEQELMDLDAYDSMASPDNLIDISLVNFEGLHQAYVRHWLQDDNIKSFVDTAASLKRKNKGFRIPNQIGRKNWDILPDLLACGIHFELWTLNEGLSLFSKYYEIRSELNKDPSGIGKYLEDYLVTFETKFKASGISLEFEPKDIKRELIQAYNAGILQTSPHNSLIAEAMNGLGYELVRNKINQFKWIKQ
jgi:hypothetical protein